MKHFSSPLFSAVLSLLLISQASHAQTASMSLMGSVQSDAMAPLPGAAVTIIHLPSGARHATASDGTGRFLIADLLAGGPYLIRVGEGGYRPQTVENIFLENGKTTHFTVTLSKLGTDEKTNSGKIESSTSSQKPEPTLALAKESVVGGPVLITTVSRPPASAVATTAQVPPQPTAMLVPAPRTAPPVAAAPAPAPHYSRYPSTPYRSAARTPVADLIVPGHFDGKTGNYVYETGQLTSLKLANGGAIAGVGVNSTESNLYRFLSNPQARVDTVDLTQGWYNFDRVFFTPGKATITPESLKQLRNVAALLQAYPNARIKLGGYTDSTGTYKVNKQLSEARARTAWASLVEMGVSPSRLDARGYGSYYSIAANTTEEGRAKNRRLSVKVLKK